MELIQIITLGLTTIFSFYFLLREAQELLFLKSILREILGKTKIDSINDIVKIKNYLQENISYNEILKNKKRPLLRHTASQILKNNYGFCGENARVAIKLFLIGGIKARRIYMFREEWQHVLIEHEYKEKWYMFDGHYDKDTVLSDDNVAKIPTNKIELYPNTYPNNPYLSYCRVKLFYPHRFSKIKLPSFVVYIFESPNLIKAVFIIWLTICILILKGLAS